MTAAAAAGVLTAGVTTATVMSEAAGVEALGDVIERHKAQFEQLRVHGYPDPNVCDVYVRAAGSQKLWFVGKACSREGAGAADGPGDVNVGFPNRLWLACPASRLCSLW